MFNLFKSKTPRISEEEKDQVSSAAWDAVINPIAERPEAAIDAGFDLLFGIANDLVTNK